MRVRGEEGARVARGVWIVRDAFGERRVSFGVRGGSERKPQVRRAVVAREVEPRGDERRELIDETRREFAVGVRITLRGPHGGFFGRRLAAQRDARGIEHAQLARGGGEKHVGEIRARRESVSEPNRPATKFHRRRRRQKLRQLGRGERRADQLDRQRGALKPGELRLQERPRGVPRQVERHLHPGGARRVGDFRHVGKRASAVVERRDAPSKRVRRRTRQTIDGGLVHRVQLAKRTRAERLRREQRHGRVHQTNPADVDTGRWRPGRGV